MSGGSHAPGSGARSSEAEGFTGAAAKESSNAAAAKAAVEAARVQNARTVNPEVAEMEGSEAPPRKNGELVFDHLWEGRTFGMAVTLSDQGLYPWRDFRASLIDVISACDASGDTTTPYYERFLAALENLAVERGLIEREALNALTSQYAAKRAVEDAARAAADAEA
jgi:nitrile hydratase accessory protein